MTTVTYLLKKCGAKSVMLLLFKQTAWRSIMIKDYKKSKYFNVPRSLQETPPINLLSYLGLCLKTITGILLLFR